MQRSFERFKINLLDDNFWQKLQGLVEIFTPIHEVKVILESGRSTIKRVYQRWRKIYARLEKLAIEDLTPFRIMFIRIYIQELNALGSRYSIDKSFLSIY